MNVVELEGRLNEPLPVPERVRLLNLIAEGLSESDPAHGVELAREAIELARAMGERGGEAQALYCLGRNLYALAEYPEVFETQNAALAVFRALGDAHGEARCRNLLGITHKQLADYGHALEMYELALRGFRQAQDLKWQARVISNVGNVEIQLGNHDTALELFDQALELRREIGDVEGAAFDLNNAAFGHVQKARRLRSVGEAQGCRIEAESAVRMLDRAIAIARQHGQKRLEAFCLQTMAEAYQAMDRPEVALAMSEPFSTLARECSDRWIEAYGLGCMGEIRHELGQHAESVGLLARAHETFESLGSRDECARVLRTLSKAHEALGELSQALACLRKAGAIEQALKSEEAERKARALSTRRRLEQARQETERYRRLAMEDSLTGLANRRRLDDRLRELLREAQSESTTVTVALVDVDHFRGINDGFSIAVGDEVLRCVGESLREHCRLGDMVGRYGGEEFLMVFRGLDLAPAAEICERVRRSVEAWDWKSIHPQLRVTVSMGLASSRSFDHAHGLLDAAEHWLHEAKHHGRNQIQPLALAPS